MVSPVVLADRVSEYFEGVNHDVFAGDPAANPNLGVEVIDAGVAHDTPVVILIAPWTLAGLATPPDGQLPSALRVGARHCPALANEVPGIGSYWSVILVPDVSGYRSQDQARAVAMSLVEPFHVAVEKARQELTQVTDPGKRALLSRVRMQGEPVGPARTAFGTPDETATRPRAD
jgi:hypothetical protein